MNQATTIQKFAKFGSVIASIAKVLIILAIIGTLLGSICLIALPDSFLSFEINTKFLSHVKIAEYAEEDWDQMAENIPAKLDGNLQIDKDDEGMLISGTQSVEFTNGQMGVALFSVLPVLALEFAFLVSLKRFCKNLKEIPTPFTPMAEKELKLMGILVILIGSVPYLSTPLFTALAHLSQSAIASLSFSAELDLKTICIGIGLIGLSFVFAYGRALQEKNTTPAAPTAPDLPSQTDENNPNAF